jgi:hypothetical protein
MVEVLKGHKERVLNLKNAIAAADLNAKFGDKSEYFHQLCTPNHAERECLYLLNNFGLHLSDINTESSEHTNKGLFKILHGRF